MTLTLRIKAALVTTLVVLGAVSVAAGWLYRQQAHDHMALLHSQQQALAGAVAAAVDDDLASTMSLIERAARQVDAAMLAQPAAREHVLALAGLRPPFNRVALVAADGLVVANDPPTPATLNIGDREYFQQARLTGRPTLSAPLRSRLDGQPMVLFTAPLFDAQHRFLGALVGSLHLQGDSALGGLARERIGDTGRYEIVTRGPAPVYVMHPDASRLLQPAAAPRLNEDNDQADVVTLRELRSAPWELRVVIPAREAHAPLLRARKVLLTALALLGIGTVLAVSAGLGWLMAPLETLSQAMRRQRQAPDELVPIDTRASDERGQLAREFEALMHELRAQRAELAAVSDTSPLGLFRAAPDGRLTYVNEAYLRMHGFTTREQAAEGWLDLLPPEQRDAARQRWREIVTETNGTNVTRHMRRADGREIVLIVRTAPLVIEGTVQGHVGTVADVTERIENERALHRSQAVISSVTDVVPMSIAVLDTAQRYLFVNRGFERWMDMVRDQVIGRTAAEVLGPQEYEARRPWIERVLAGEAVAFERDDPLRPRMRHVRLDYIPLFTERGDVEGFVVVAADISASRAEERRLRDLAHTDALTGLLNRTGFQRALDDLAPPPGEAGDGGLAAMLFIDLDRFKPINDEHGHAVGDELLKAFGARLRSLVRPTDTIARLGGDEFVIVLSGLRETANAMRVADKVVESAARPFDLGGGIVVKVGASVGVAFWRPGQERWSESLADADTQLYRAKAGGRGRAVGANS
jgi:diguanylate cyclase (GGDEF)-like protein/PAS domain S-box-containing protein